MDRFRLTTTGLIKEAEPGTVQHAIYSRSHRYELVPDDEPAETTTLPGHLETRSIPELRSIAETIGVDLGGLRLKREIIAKIREDRDAP